MSYNDMKSVKEKISSLQERFKETIDHKVEVDTWYDFVDKNDSEYVDGYLQGRKDLERKSVTPMSHGKKN